MGVNTSHTLPHPKKKLSFETFSPQKEVKSLDIASSTTETCFNMVFCGSVGLESHDQLDAQQYSMLGLPFQDMSRHAGCA